MTTLDLIITIAKYGFAFVGLALIPLMIFMERKGAAIIQDRIGPNRAEANIFNMVRIRGFGMVHNLTDVVKLLWKEDFIPKNAHKWFYIVAPIIPVFTAVVTPALIPWFAPIEFTGSTFEKVGGISGQIIDANAGILMLFALGSLSVYGVVLGSWSSNSKFSLLGGMRSSAMMISYEVSMGLSLLGLFMIVGSFSLTNIVEWQAENTWGVVAQPVGFFLFLTAMFAETGRTPFDVAEGESEIVGGFHTEYSSIKFALFFMGEYCHIVIASALIATLFFGGYHLPFLSTDVIKGNVTTVIGVGGILKAMVLFGICRMIIQQKKRYAAKQAKDHDIRMREYSVLTAIVGAMGIAALIVTVVAFSYGEIDAMHPAAAILTALIQVGIVILKTLFFCWVFVWVRWTLPRLRYDQIMALGWKVMLNIALVNLAVTALILKIVEG